MCYSRPGGTGMEKTIDAVLAAAEREGRGSLYEHEVYAVLAAAGLEVPRHLFVRDPADLREADLRGFGAALIVKIVSAGIPHKQKLGGVKRVSAADVLYVQFVMGRMKEEVLSCFGPNGTAGPVPPPIDGFLVVEYVPHTEALGYEVLIGLREDPAFGPVLTLSKGGDDAEFFAAQYDPANIFLPPMSLEGALALCNGLHIRHKFAQTGHLQYLELMARAMAAFSTLGERYSPLAKKPRWIFSELEVNPFAISRDGRFVALDGLAGFYHASKADAWRPGVNAANLESFFHPDGVAVIGVSADLGKYSLGREIASLLHDLRGGPPPRGDLVLVNPHGGTVTLGGVDHALLGDLSESKRTIELAVYAAPAVGAPEFLRSLAGTSVRAVILISGVPASVSYSDFARQLRDAAPAGLRVIGPNCMGVFQGATPGVRAVNTLFLNEKRLEVRSSETSNTALVTQSGALAVTILDKLRACRPFRAVASFGNKFDVKASDLVAWFARDPAVRQIALYLEGLDPGEGRELFDLARTVRTPIVAYKAGRTEAGARSAASHTASLSGNYEVFRAACGQSGVILADTIDDWYNFVRTFSLLAGRPPAGNRVAGVVNAGFESTVGADELKGLTQARLTPRTLQKLNSINRSGLVDTHSPFLDLTPMADDAAYAEFTDAVMADENVDCVFVAVVPHSVFLKTVPETCRDADSLASRLVEISRRTRKPMVVSVNAGRHYEEFVAALEEGGLPVYEDIRAAITSLDVFVSHSLSRTQAPGGR
jgi:3-hydroxypropionyl-CoA synthetase (ADP-forming)